MEFTTDNEIDIFESILNKCCEFSFYQLIRHFEKLYSKRLLLLPNQSLGFPANDIVIDRSLSDINNQASVMINFLGLYGVDSPLPFSFNNVILQQTEFAVVLRSIINIFCNEFYYLLYLAWKKYRIEIQLELGDQTFLHYLVAISANKFKLTDYKLLRYTAEYGTIDVNIAALKNLMHGLSKLKVSVEEFNLYWIKLAKANLIGMKTCNFCLGDNSILGTEILSTYHLIIITLGPIDVIRYMDEFIQGPRLNEIHDALQVYLPWHMSYRLKINLSFDKKYRSLIAKRPLVLGLNCCLGLPKSNYNIFGNVA